MSAPSLPLPEPSPVDAAREAYDHTRRLLFPFRFEHWLTLGLVAFLDQCGRGGMGGALPGGPPGTGLPTGSDTGSLSDFGSWFTANLGLIVAVAVGVLVVVVVVVAVVVWIGSRATFVYVDDVASGRAELSRPWKAHAEQANSYFAWRFGLAAALLVALALLIAFAAAAALLVSRGGASAAGGVVLLVVLAPAFILVLVAGGLGAVALRDFVAPLQVHGRTSCGEALAVLGSLLRAYPLAFLLYIVLKIVFEVVRGMILVLGACLTLCCILLPVVTQTALQPLFFFERAWSLCLLRQMGYDVIGGPAAPAGPLEAPGAARV
ncbi:MAG TPA: hypothetical protein VMR21_14025 [Vicinamibacteria bacterium]|nr:hypothetical protein [Vicinamibacteria bacterium]